MIVALLAAGRGQAPISPAEVAGSLLHRLGLDLGPSPSAVQGENALWLVRFPRVTLAIVVGASLGCAGALMRGVFGNPLAEPGVVGVSAGAAVGARKLDLLALGEGPARHLGVDTERLRIVVIVATTLLAALAGDVKAEGVVEVAGRAIGSYRAVELARVRSVLPQKAALSFPFTVGEVIRMGRAPWAGQPERAGDEAAVAEAMRQTETTDFAQ